MNHYHILVIHLQDGRILNGMTVLRKVITIPRHLTFTGHMAYDRAAACYQIVKDQELRKNSGDNVTLLACTDEDECMLRHSVNFHSEPPDCTCQCQDHQPKETQR